MKKKALLYGLSAALLLASLTACGTSQADQPTEPDPTPTPSAVQTQPPETPEPEETTSPVEPMAMTLRKPIQEELLSYFQIVYESGQLPADLELDDDFILALELEQLHVFFDVDPELEKPADLDAQYLAWRETNHPQEPEVTQAPSSNTQTEPVQQAPSTASTPTQTPDSMTTSGLAGYDPNYDPSQSSVFKPMDDPWASQAKIDYTGTGGLTETGDEYYKSHQGGDPAYDPAFKPMDDPWDTDYTIDYGGAGG